MSYPLISDNTFRSRDPASEVTCRTLAGILGPVGYRSGFTLVCLLEDTLKLTRSGVVRGHIDEALAFTNSGPDTGGHRYPRGRRLVTHLENAANAATEAGEENVARRLDDFAEYASGDIPLSLLERWYIPEQQEMDDELARRLLEVGLRRSADIVGQFVHFRPEAGAGEVHDWLARVATEMHRWTTGEDRRGGVKLPRYAKDPLVWLERIQLVLDSSSASSEVPPEIADELAGLAGSEVLARAVQWKRRRSALERLRAVVEDPASSEQQIQAELRQQTWIFGGRYVRTLDRSSLTTTDSLDIPLLRGDGSLHVVELKKASVPNLVEQRLSHPTVGPDVHRAVLQATNYLRSLDEQRATILAEHNIEARRASATVLIGHAGFLRGKYEPAEISAAFRTYNAALSRIEVMTYDELLESAGRTLELDDAEL
ncbi:DUF4263 domain-containing protein [Amycolatopsis acidicola]|uniref:DUF4263 domain-containing protein n=1 Tax=Amycolatopsis acidicola TaxID=2596893 RepID=A0A5N0VNV8_9PSEU|nr:Shedu anti-phage system protein SduA domain-containing protein [Amycolatopsis acidicola]KAA9166311.1 DUF4263 domain-containing protein [Amycolatopsis acidicola]